MTRKLALAALLLPTAACGLVGPLCVARQEEGPVTTVSGSVSAGAIASHALLYDTRGSQNTARITWPGQADADGARLQVFATGSACQHFSLPAEANTGACAVLARGGWAAPGAVAGLILTHGRGNPEILGSPPGYILWITSDKSTTFTIAISYFYGPDC